MTNTTLIEILTSYIAYDQSMAIYAEKIDGDFSEESPARFGQVQFENGGLLDDCALFGRNDMVVDALESWMDGGDRSVIAEAASEVIFATNEEGK